MDNSRGNFASGTPQGSFDVTHTFPVQFNTTGIASGVKVGTILASTTNPVEVEVFYQVVTAFDATTTNVLTAGTSTTATEWIGAGGVNELVTGFYPASASSKVYTFAGVAAAGPITLTGAVKGDVVQSVSGITTVGSAAASFESTITVANQIQQSSASDLSLQTYIVQLQSAGTANRFRLTANTDVYAKYTQSGTAATTGSALLIVRCYSVNTIPIA